MSKFIRKRGVNVSKTAKAPTSGFTEAELAAAVWAKSLPEVRQNYERLTNAERRDSRRVVGTDAPARKEALPPEKASRAPTPKAAEASESPKTEPRHGSISAKSFEVLDSEDEGAKLDRKMRKAEKKLLKEEMMLAKLSAGDIAWLEAKRCKAKKAKKAKKEKKELRQKEEAESNAAKERAPAGEVAQGVEKTSKPAEGDAALFPAFNRHGGHSAEAAAAVRAATTSLAPTDAPLAASAGGKVEPVSSAPVDPALAPVFVPRDPLNPLEQAYNLKAYQEWQEKRRRQCLRRLRRRERGGSRIDGGSLSSGRSSQSGMEDWDHKPYLRRSPSPCRLRTEGGMAPTRKNTWRSRAGGIYLPPEEGPRGIRYSPSPSPARYLYPEEFKKREEERNVRRSPSYAPEPRKEPTPSPPRSPKKKAKKEKKERKEKKHKRKSSKTPSASSRSRTRKQKRRRDESRSQTPQERGSPAYEADPRPTLEHVPRPPEVALPEAPAEQPSEAEEESLVANAKSALDSAVAQAMAVVEEAVLAAQADSAVASASLQ